MRRAWDDSLADRMTELLRTPEGTQKLRPIQAQALYEIGTYGGMFGPIRVGGGKTLVSLLAARVAEARRPLLLLPAALIEKTNRERLALSKHWRVAKHLRLFSYEMLGRVNAARELAMYRPDLIIADECHRLKNKRAGVTRRVVRYMKEFPDTRFVAMSGTVMKDSLHDFAHLIHWTHKDRAPVPLTEDVVSEWADCLDEKAKALSRKEPGALLEWADGLGSDLVRARRGFQRRLTETPGVVSFSTQDYQGSLYIRGIQYAVNDQTESHFKTLRTAWERPDGWALSEAVEVWRHAREIALGLVYVWNPHPPDSWLGSRRDWARFVRDFLSRSRKLDTELQVANGVSAGEIDDGGVLNEWRRIKPTFEVNSQPIWHDEAALRICADWLESNNGICWVEHRFFGDELARLTKLPYFGSGGQDAHGNPIEGATGPIIASIAANGTGRNLQKWSKNLITSVPGPMQLEQLLGRTHRDGQEADEVTADILLGCRENLDAFWRAVAQARAQSDMLGMTYKLLLADIDIPSDIVSRDFRWKQTRKKNGC